MGSQDIQLQRAILASLAPAPRPLPASRSSFTSTFAPPLRGSSSSTTRRTALPSDGIGGAKRAGRIDSLSREGIAPPARTGMAARGALSSKEDGRGGGGGGEPWIRKSGRGTISSSAGGRSGTISCDTSSSIFSPPETLHTGKSRSYTVDVDVQFSSGSPGNVQFLLGVKSFSSPASYVSVSLRSPLGNDGGGGGTWSIERHSNGHVTRIAEQGDRELKSSSYQAVNLSVLGQCVSVSCNDRLVFSGIDVGGGLAGGDIGIAVAKSRLLFKGFKVSQVDSAEASDSPQKASSGPRQCSNAQVTTVSHATARKAQGRYEGGDDPKFIETIERDILANRLGTQWGDIAKLDEAKRLLQEAVVLPLLMPELYVGIRQPWKGVLLFGPPGTGKTLLARAVASEAQTTFFNVSAATLVSKYHGESEKLVRTLFGMARHYAPSTIFFDEIDGLMGQRGAQAEHEASRRLKGEILSQMDGIANAAAESSRSSDDPALVMVLATTNKPWDLDEALRRRLEKRIFIPLPDLNARVEMLRLFLATVQCSEDIDLPKIAASIEGFSGSDVHVLCREASMAPMRRMTAQHGALEMVRLKQEGKLDLQVRLADILEAQKRTQSSVSSRDLEQYVRWDKEFANN